MISQLKYQHALKNVKLVTGLQFRAVGSGQYVLFQTGPQCLEIMVVAENSTRQVAALNMKHLSGKFEAFAYGERYVYALSQSQSEVLVLRGELLVSFFPSELLLCKAVATYRTQYEPINAAPADSEVLTAVQPVGEEVLLVGTSLGRVHMYHVRRLEGEQMACQACRTAGSLPYPVVEAALVLTQQLTASPVAFMEHHGGRTILQQENHQGYISDQATPELFGLLQQVQTARAAEQDRRVEQIYDSVLKYRQLLADERGVRLDGGQLTCLQPQRFHSKLAIDGLGSSTRYQVERFRSPVEWPRLLHSCPAEEPFLTVQQAQSSAIQGLRLELQGHPFSTRLLGAPFYETGTPAVACSACDEANLLAVVDAAGAVRVYDLQAGLPLVSYTFALPEQMQLAPENIEDDVDDALLAYQAISRRSRGGGDEAQPQAQDDVKGRRYKATAVAVHTGGRQIVIGCSMQGGLSNYQYKLGHLVAVLNLAQNRLFLATIIEQDSPVKKIAFDGAYNNLYILNQTQLLVFNFYEMRCVATIDLGIRSSFVNRVLDGYFSKQDLERQQQLNE